MISRPRISVLCSQIDHTHKTFAHQVHEDKKKIAGTTVKMLNSKTIEEEKGKRVPSHEVFQQNFSSIFTMHQTLVPYEH